MADAVGLRTPRTGIVEGTDVVSQVHGVLIAGRRLQSSCGRAAPLIRSQGDAVHRLVEDVRLAPRRWTNDRCARQRAWPRGAIWPVIVGTS